MGLPRIYTDEQRRERVRESKRKWQQANPERVRESARKVYSKKRAAKIAALRQFYLDNPAQDRRKVAR